jgi:hypothetical protein
MLITHFAVRPGITRWANAKRNTIKDLALTTCKLEKKLIKLNKVNVLYLEIVLPFKQLRTQPTLPILQSEI